MKDMSRRGFLKFSGMGMFFSGLASVHGQKADKSKPNLLVIHTDQQSAWTISAYGTDLVKTPHIDSLAKDGAILTNFFTNSAVCTPSRGCFVTGRYPNSHGAYKNNIELGRDEITFAEVLRGNGYSTGYCGKWHLDGPPKPGFMKPDRSMGFADCRYMFNRGHYKKIVDQPDGTAKVFPYNVMGDEKTFTTDWLTGKAIDFISVNKDKPFCYMISIPDPHSPYTVRKPYDTMYDPEDMPLPATLNEKDRPGWAGSKPPAAERLKQTKARYCGQVKCIDDCVGRILKCLKENSLEDNTVVVFTTDHGDYMGEHGLMAKNNLYETAYRIPFLIKFPGRIPAGRKVDNVISTVDFHPTVLALMGFKPSGREQGRNFLDLLTGKGRSWDDYAMIYHSSNERAGIYTDKWFLAFVKGSDHVLFDRLNDPQQVTNLYNDERCKGVIRELYGRILGHFSRAKAPAADWLKEIKV